MKTLERQVLQAASVSPATFYKVSECRPGIGLRVRGLFHDVTCFIDEKTGSKKIEVGDILFGQIVCVQGINTFYVMAPHLIPSDYEKPLTDVRDRLQNTMESKLDAETLRRMDTDLVFPIY